MAITEVKIVDRAEFEKVYAKSYTHVGPRHITHDGRVLQAYDKKYNSFLEKLRIFFKALFETIFFCCTKKQQRQEDWFAVKNGFKRVATDRPPTRAGDAEDAMPFRRKPVFFGDKFGDNAGSGLFDEAGVPLQKERQFGSYRAGTSAHSAKPRPQRGNIVFFEDMRK